MTSVEPMQIPKGYKQTEVEVIPEDWYVSSLQNVCRAPITYGIVQCGPHINNGVPYIRVSDMNLRELDASSMLRTSSKISDSFKRSQVEEGDIVYALRGKLGEVRLVNSFVAGANLTQGTARIAPSKIISNKYLFWILQSSISLKQSIQEAKGSTFIEITLADLKDILVPVPKLAQEQTAIANALSDVDNLIASLETLIAKKSAIKTAAMQQLLTGKKRLPGFEGKNVKESAKQSSELDNTNETAQAAQTKQTPTLNSGLYKESGEGFDAKSNQHSDVDNANNKQTAPRPGYKQSELGEIPEDWEARCVGDSCDLLTGYPFPSVSYSDHGIRLLRGSNVKRGNTDWSEGITQYWPKITADIKQYELCEGDIVISMDGSLVGRSFAQLSQADLPAVLLQRVARLRSTSVSVSFLKEWVCSKFFTEHCDSVKTVTAIPHISPEDIRIFRFLCPPTIEEQTAIANVLSDMDTELGALQQRLNKTKKIKQGMMQELLTGKTRLV